MAKRKNDKDLYGGLDLFSLYELHPEYYQNRDDLGIVVEEKVNQVVEHLVDLEKDETPQITQNEIPNSQINEFLNLKQFNNTFSDFKLDEPIELGGEKERFRKNIESIKLVNEIYPKLKSAKRGEIELNITTEQQRIVAGFSGWGGINGLFDHKNEKWANERVELIELIGEEAYNEAKEANLTAYYTPKNIVEAIHKGLDRLGINNDRPDIRKEILEPSAGNGSFIAFNKNDNFHFTTIEKETFTAKMNEILYPNQTNYNARYEIFNRDNQYDAVIGNPPFLEVGLSDKVHTDLYGSAHNFFMQKATQYNLKENGITAFVVSRHFMDAKYNSARDEIAQNHTFLGAVRLPNNVFKHTEAETDIIFLQKGKHEYGKDISQISNTQMIGSEEISQNINQYFINNPQNILAKPTYRMGQFGKAVFYEPKKDENFNLDIALSEFINTLPQNVYKWVEPNEIKDYEIENFKDNYEYAKNIAVGGILIDGSDIVKRVPSLAFDDVRVAKLDINNKAFEKTLKRYIPLRDKLKELIALEQTEIKDDDPKLTKTRADLNLLLDDFHEQEGFLSGQKCRQIQNYDIEFAKVQALEKNYKKPIKTKGDKAGQIESCEKANILLHRTINYTPKIKFETVQDGVFASVYTYGKIDVKFIADKLNKDKNEVENEIVKSKLGFYEPQKLLDGNKELTFAPIYLSGNVKQKLREAKDLKELYPQELSTNLEELNKIIPKDISFTDIDTRLGSSWIPIKYYDEFLQHELQTSNENGMAWKIANLGDMGWRIQGNRSYISYKAHMNYGVEVRDKIYNRQIGDRYTTHTAVGNDKSIYDIVESAFNNVPIKIMEKTDEPLLNKDGNEMHDKNGNTIYKQVVCPELSAEANAKVETLKSKFNEWIFSNRIRAKELERIYNDKFNCYVKAQYDGDGLDFNGLDSNIKLRKHQKDAVFRSIVSKNILLDHEVGAGKTFAGIAAVMKQKELGLIKKPLIIVPNNLIPQWHQDFFKAYPNANILVANENSLSPKQRDDFLAQIQNNDWDAVIIKYTQIDRLPVPFKTKQEILDKELKELQGALSYYEEVDEITNKNSARRIQKAILKTKEKVEKLADDRAKSKIMDFSSLGVDSIVVDEAHNFKNLSIISPMRAKGKGANISSQRAFNMLAITNYINSRQDGKVMFLTGTPVSNSLSEIYNMQRYLQPEILKEQGIDSFSSWASVFAGIDISPVRDASGRIKMEARFSSLTNLPELSNMLNQVTDTITNDDIKAFTKNFVPNKEVIYQKSQKSEEIAKYIGEPDNMGRYSKKSITGRLIKMEGGGYDPRIDNPLKVTNDAKKASIDFRLIDPNAKDYADSKINIAVDEIYKEYKEWNDKKGTQLVFLDVGTPKDSNEKSFNLNLQNDLSREVKEIAEYSDEDENLAQMLDRVEKSGEIINDTDENGQMQRKEEFDDSRFFLYGDIYKKLVDKGIPREQIAFIHDAETNEEKKGLYAKVNSGEIRVLLGSRAKMGTGVNVQQRVVALHHIDCPWRPSDITQSNGRAIRQGNIFYEADPDKFIIKEFRHITPGTFDERNWELQSKKNEAILNFRKGIVGERSLSGFEEDLLNSNEARAVASENPLIFTEFELNEAIKKEKNEIKRHKEQLFSNEEEFEKNLAKISKLEKLIAKMDDIRHIVKEHSSENLNLTINSFQASNYNAIQAQPHNFTIPRYKENDFMKFKETIVNELKNSEESEFNVSKFKTIFENLEGFGAVRERLKNLDNEYKKEFYDAVISDYKTENKAELEFIKKIIKPELEQVQATQIQMGEMFNGAINLLYASKGKEYEIMEYKGFKITCTAQDSALGTEVFFALKNESKNIELEPETLEYIDNASTGQSAREQIKFKGVLIKINNILSENGLNERLKNNQNELKDLQSRNEAIKNWLENNQNYKKQELLNRLLEDLKTCNAENDKMSVNRSYKSKWKSEALIEYKNWNKKQKEILINKMRAEEQGISLDEYLSKQNVIQDTSKNKVSNQNLNKTECKNETKDNKIKEIEIF